MNDGINTPVAIKLSTSIVGKIMRDSLECLRFSGKFLRLKGTKQIPLKFLSEGGNYKQSGETDKAAGVIT